MIQDREKSRRTVTKIGPRTLSVKTLSKIDKLNDLFHCNDTIKSKPIFEPHRDHNVNIRPVTTRVGNIENIESDDANAVNHWLQVYNYKTNSKISQSFSSGGGMSFSYSFDGHDFSRSRCSQFGRSKSGQNSIDLHNSDHGLNSGNASSFSSESDTKQKLISSMLASSNEIVGVRSSSSLSSLSTKKSSSAPTSSSSENGSQTDSSIENLSQAAIANVAQQNTIRVIRSVSSDSFSSFPVVCSVSSSDSESSMTVMAKINQFKEIYNIGIIGWRCNVCLVNNKCESKLCIICKRPNALKAKGDRTSTKRTELNSYKPSMIPKNNQDAFSKTLGSNSENIEPSNYSLPTENVGKTKSIEISVDNYNYEPVATKGYQALKCDDSLQAFTDCGYTKIEAIKLKFFLEQNALLQNNDDNVSFSKMMSSDSLIYSADDNIVDNKSRWSESPLAFLSQLDVDSLSPTTKAIRTMQFSPSITPHVVTVPLPRETDVDTFGFFPAVVEDPPELQQLSPKRLLASPFEANHGRHQSDDSTVLNNFGFSLSRLSGSTNMSKSFHHRNYSSFSSQATRSMFTSSPLHVEEAQRTALLEQQLHHLSSSYRERTNRRIYRRANSCNSMQRYGNSGRHHQSDSMAESLALTSNFSSFYSLKSNGSATNGTVGHLCTEDNSMLNNYNLSSNLLPFTSNASQYNHGNQMDSEHQTFTGTAGNFHSSSAYSRRTSASEPNSPTQLAQNMFTLFNRSDLTPSLLQVNSNNTDMMSKDDGVQGQPAAYRYSMPRCDPNFVAPPQRSHRRCSSWTSGQKPPFEPADAHYSFTNPHARGVYRVPQRYNQNNIVSSFSKQQYSSAESNYSLVSNETETPCWGNSIHQQQQQHDPICSNDISIQKTSTVDLQCTSISLATLPMIVADDSKEIMKDDCHPIEIIFLDNLAAKDDALHPPFIYELNPDRKQIAASTEGGTRTDGITTAILWTDNKNATSSDSKSSTASDAHSNSDRNNDPCNNPTVPNSPRTSGLMKNSIAKSYVEHLMEKNKAQKGTILPIAPSKHHRNQSY
mmetsp:Transcript_3128/g.4399  ORF Transcript_3128/g.4399 Transcript_3128/m.4399 type:complete len:1048 (+) Transcript_3128:70-3213(+)|eukprot:CAMPEP_0170067286 /NCGR_PEP_ID=MMETSP0019_2-20121128/6694_1 /TAXON_ID=98059 /ORGANISM="Dinobryon sp., Strain UTEXLB2267" /LENGTH=1047 /DNA_ID=CAMNT_0010274645 /DNA_START=27 /DNA_END=3170 /DNA_ORIENTATION=+